MYAKPVTDTQIKNVAVNFMYKHSRKRLKVQKIIDSKEMLSQYPKVQDENIKLIKLKPKGWVLVSGDDIAKPVLGYSLENTFDEHNIPPQLLAMLKSWSDEIAYAKKQTKISIPIKTSIKWKKYSINPSNYIKQYTSQKVFLKTSRAYDSWQLEQDVSLVTPRWGQNRYYNLYTPQDSRSIVGNDHTLTGCVATAMSEIIRYNQWPEVVQNLQAYDDNNRFNRPDTYQNITPQRADTPYNWSAMPISSLTSPNDEVSRLIQHAGIAVRMDYGYDKNGSEADGYNYPTNVGTEVTNAMRHNFSYRHRGIHFRNQYDDSDWKSFLRTDLRQGFPIYYTGYSSVKNKKSGHAFVIEGFSTDDGDDYFSINFGWGGYGNGDFELDHITADGYQFTNKQRAIFSLKPNNSTYRDVYEDDNTHKKASYMRVGDTQATHSIDPANDTDWVTFWNDTYGSLRIETTNTSGDTVMYLYDSQGNQIAYNDDFGGELSSKIDATLYSGRYYIKVISYHQQSKISSYDLKVTRN